MAQGDLTSNCRLPVGTETLAFLRAIIQCMAASPTKQPMKVPLQLECRECQAPATIKLHLDATSFDWRCSNCGCYHPSFFGTNVTIGYLVLERSRYELVREEDFSMAIVMAAMAFECELSGYFGKWKQIDAEKAAGIFGRKQCEKELRDLKTIERKIDAVSKLLVGKGMDDFVSSCPDLRQKIDEEFTSVRVGSLPKDFQTELFWPRNLVLHWGDTKHSQDDAARCYSIARLGLSILHRMDKERRSTL